jgi:hypothetical protein
MKVFICSPLTLFIDINDFEIDNYAKFRFVKVDKKNDNHDGKPYEYDQLLDYEDEKHQESTNSVEL